MHILFQEQAVYGKSTKWKKAYLTGMSNIATCFYHPLTGSETMSQLLKKQRQKKVKKEFLW